MAGEGGGSRSKTKKARAPSRGVEVTAGDIQTGLSIKRSIEKTQQEVSNFFSDPKKAAKHFFFSPITLEEVGDRLLWRVAPGIAFSLLAMVSAAVPVTAILCTLSIAAIGVGYYKGNATLFTGGISCILVLALLPAVVAVIATVAKVVMAVTALELVTRGAYTAYSKMKGGSEERGQPLPERAPEVDAAPGMLPAR